MAVTNDKTSELVLAYYDSWKNGMADFDETRLKAILAPDLEFEGPFAGRQHGAQALLPGLIGFVKTLKELRFVQKVQSGNEAAVLYDCDITLPAGTFRFVEFFRVEDDKIQQINLVFDTSEFRKLAQSKS